MRYMENKRRYDPYFPPRASLWYPPLLEIAYCRHMYVPSCHFGAVKRVVWEYTAIEETCCRRFVEGGGSSRGTKTLVPIKGGVKT